MSLAIQNRPARPSAVLTNPAEERPVSEIIARARTAPPPFWGGGAMAAATAVLTFCSFYPLNWGWLGWIAPVPLLLLARIARPTRGMYLGLWLAGAAFWVPALQWMRLGDPAMIPAWLALACYLACYWPITIGVLRLAVQRLHAPLALAAPTVWVAGEYLRSHLLTGFGWYLAGHSQHEFLALIQMSDLVGVYGVSFLVLLSAAALAECVPATWFARLRLLPPVCDLSTAVQTLSPRGRWVGVMTSVLLVSAAVWYGFTRLEQGEFTPGPRVALVQGDFASQVKQDRHSAEHIYVTHVEIMGLAVKHRPDVIVWPETMLPFPMLLAEEGLTDEELAAQFPQTPPELWHEPRADVRLALRDRAEQAGAPLIVGVLTQAAARDGARRYNSAVLVEPEQGITGRYDKIHLVPFGEYLPLQNWLPFLEHASPYGKTSIDPGDQVHVFRVGSWRLLPTICFEDTVPHLVRRMIALAAAPAEAGAPPRPIDCLVNLTNDGWFRNSSEQEQHLITAAFRCIETRTPMVRAVNTGISALIDGNGVVREPIAFLDYDRFLDPAQPPRTTLRDPHTGRFHKSLNAALVVDVPLDPRDSLYLWWGDWFAAGCLVLTLAALGWSLVLRFAVPPSAGLP